MPLILRKIKRPRWYDIEDLDWLPQGSLPADPLADLNTQGNKLSVWQVDDNKSNVDQILTALATTTEHTGKIDYALFDPAILVGIGIKIEHASGDSLMKDANIWHYNLIEMSADKVIQLAKEMLQSSIRTRVFEKRVIGLLQKAVDSGKVKRSALNPDIQKKLN